VFAGGGFTAGGDLSGTGSSQQVIGLLTHALPSLTTGYLNWTGSAWALSTVSGTGLADPGSNGIIKRTALNVTAPAVSGTDYVAPNQVSTQCANLGAAF